MVRGTVRQHTRRTASGKRTTVRRHGRRTRGVSPRHSGKLARQAFRNWRRRRRMTACVLGGLAVAEFGAWAGLRGAFFMLTTVGVLALGVAYLAASASGGEAAGAAGRKAPQRGRAASWANGSPRGDFKRRKNAAERRRQAKTGEGAADG
jgi:hypothetical protein